MKIAVIGAGRIGAMHAATVRDLPSVDEVIVVDIDADRAKSIAEELACTFAPDVEALWDSSLDAVIITSATRTHLGLVHAAIDHEVSVLCEKPLTLDLRASQLLADRARDSGCYVTVGFQRRFDPSFRTLRHEVVGGAYGSAFVMQMTHADTAPPPPGYLSTAPGRMFVDMCVHDFDAMRWVAGSEIQSVVAEAVTISDFTEYREFGDVDTIVATLKFENGSIGVLTASRHSPDGYIANMAIRSLGFSGGTPLDRRDSTWMGRFAEAFRNEASEFVGVLSGSGQRGATVEDATKALQAAMAAERSWAEGRRVELEEIG